MPNGIECRAAAAARSRVTIGRGRLLVGGLEITPGPGWNPVPLFDPVDSLPPGPEPPNRSLSAWIGDAVLAGYVAGLVLLHGQRTRAENVADRAIAQAEPLTATLLRHAARGEVPESIHELLATGDSRRLIASWPAGIAWLRGLLSAGLPLDPVSGRIAANRRAVPTPA
jgi:hypothetical protein